LDFRQYLTPIPFKNRKIKITWRRGAARPFKFRRTTSAQSHYLGHYLAARPLPDNLGSNLEAYALVSTWPGKLRLHPSKLTASNWSLHPQIPPYILKLVLTSSNSCLHPLIRTCILKFVLTATKTNLSWSALRRPSCQVLRYCRDE
jgi:hypothetical protein